MSGRDWLRRRSVRLAGGLLAGAVVFAAAFEAAVRLWAPQELTSEIYAFDGAVCHRLKPGTTGSQQSAEFRVDLSINAHGLRDRAYTGPKPDDVFRILFLGDSHTFGYGVALEGTYPKVVERVLNTSHTDRRYEVLNGGTIGYGTGHQYQFLTNYALELEPDLVVVTVNLLHDVKINNEMFVADENMLTRTKAVCKPAKSYEQTRLIPFTPTLRANSHAFRFLGATARSLVGGKNGKRAEPTSAARAARYELGTTQRIFSLMKRELDARGIELAVVFLSIAPLRPAGWNVDQQSVAALEQRTLHDLQAYLSDIGIKFFSFDDAFSQHPFPPGIAFDQSFHFNARGHEFLARSIARFLETTGTVNGFGVECCLPAAVRASATTP